MEIARHLKNYISLSGSKSGFLMTGGECCYLFGNRFCAVKCELLRLRSETIDLMTQYHDGMLVVIREGEPSVYICGKRLLRVTELFLMYSVNTEEIGQLFGVISGGSLPNGDVRFSEPRLCELFKAVLKVKNEQSKLYSEELNELKRLMDKSDIKELNGLYISGKPIEKEN